MTKQWELVKDRICQLVAEGHSLTKIRECLVVEHKFDASIRAYRLKLKQWKVRKLDSSSASRPATLGISETVRSAPDEHFSSVSRSSERPVPSRPTESQGDVEPVSSVTAEQATSLDSYNEAITRRLVNSASLGSRTEIFSSLQFVEGTDTMIHYLVRRMTSSEAGEFSVTWDLVQMLLENMVDRGIGLDLVDGHGWTILHYITNSDSSSDRFAHVEYLLGLGAQGTKTTPDGLTPLDLAIDQLDIDRDNGDITLLYALNVNVDEGVACLRRAMKRLMSDIWEDAFTVGLLLQTVEMLSARPRARSDASERLYNFMCNRRADAFRVFDRLSERGTKPREGENCQDIAQKTLALFLQPKHGTDDLERLDGQRGFRMLCPSGQCNSALLYSISHSPTQEYVRLIERALDKDEVSPFDCYVMLSAVLHPCACRSMPDLTRSHVSLVRRLVRYARAQRPHQLDGASLVALLGKSNYTPSDQADLLRQIVRADPLSAYACCCGKYPSESFIRPLLELIHLQPLSRGYELASALYSAELEDWHRARDSAGPKAFRLFAYDPKTNLMAYGSMEFLYALTAHLGPDNNLDPVLNTIPAIRIHLSPSEILERGMRLILHAVTENVISQCSEAILASTQKQPVSSISNPARTLMEALELRRAKHLPDIKVSGDVLLHPDMLTHLKRSSPSVDSRATL